MKREKKAKLIIASTTSTQNISREQRGRRLSHPNTKHGVNLFYPDAIPAAGGEGKKKKKQAAKQGT